MRFRVIFVGLLLALAVFASGCGGGSGSGTSGSGGSSASDSTSASSTEADGTGSEETKETSEKRNKLPPKSPLIKEGETICKEVPENYSQKLKKLEKENGGKPLPPKESNLKAALPPLNAAIEEFEQLSVSGEEEQDVEAVVTALEAAAKGLEEEPEAELSGPKSPFAEFQKVSGEIGLQTCAAL